MRYYYCVEGGSRGIGFDSRTCGKCTDTLKPRKLSFSFFVDKRVRERRRRRDEWNRFTVIIFSFCRGHIRRRVNTAALLPLFLTPLPRVDMFKETSRPRARRSIDFPFLSSPKNLLFLSLVRSPPVVSPAPMLFSFSNVNNYVSASITRTVCVSIVKECVSFFVRFG